MTFSQNYYRFYHAMNTIIPYVCATRDNTDVTWSMRPTIVPGYDAFMVTVNIPLRTPMQFILEPEDAEEMLTMSYFELVTLGKDLALR